MTKWQDFKEEVYIIFGLYIWMPIMIIFEILYKLFKRKKCGEKI